MTMDGVAGVSFAVWAPNAKRVSVVGGFNNWDGRVNVMRKHPTCGVWDIFIPGIGQGELYKYEIKTQQDYILVKSDPVAFYSEKDRIRHLSFTISKIIIGKTKTG